MKNKRQNAVLLLISLVFFAISFGTVAESVKTASPEVTATPTPKKAVKKTPTPTPKKTTSMNSTKSKSNSNTKKITNSKTTSNSKTVANKSNSNSKAKTNSKTNSNSKAKTNSNSNKKANTNSSKTNSKANTKTNVNSSKTNSKANSNKAANSNSSKKTNTNTAIITPKADLPKVIVNTTASRIRTQASSSSAELRRAKLGTVLGVSEKKGSWYRVQYVVSGKNLSGWIPATAVSDFDANAADEMNSQIVERYFATDGMSFETASELFEFLSKSKTTSADLGLKRLLSLRQALKAMSQPQNKDQREFLKTYDDQIIYSEPSGEWYVRSEKFWDLHSKNKSDEIAWEAAKNPLAGECEGYVNCHLFYIRQTDGEYLNLYPEGKHSPEALTNITNMLDPIVADLTDKSVYNGPSDVSDRAEFNKVITELRAIISKLGFIEKEKSLQQLEKIAEGFR